MTTLKLGVRLPCSPARIFRPGLATVLVVLCWLCRLPATAGNAAQRHEKAYALIYGTVWGPDSLPVYGVKIRIRRADENKFRWELYSDHQGEFALRVPPGPADYVVTADLKGYKSPGRKHLELAEEVKVHVDNEEREDIGLHLK